MKSSRWACWVAGLLLSCAAAAQTYPIRPIRLVNPYPPGGAADAVARLLAQELGTRLGQSVVVESPVGAGGSIGTGQVARSDPDGYTLLFANTGNISINPFLYRQLPYDTREFVPVAMVGSTDLVLVTHAGTNYRSLADIVQRAREQRQLPCAHAGSGTINHLSLAAFKASTGVTCTEVPYKGAGPALTDLLAGHVDYFFATVPSVLSHVEGGKLLALGTTGPRRSQALRNVPTLKEVGVNGMELSLWFGILAPAKTPTPIVTRLEQALQSVMATPSVQQRLDGMSVERRFMPAGEFAAFLAADRDLWRSAVQRSGATVQ